MPGVHLRGCTYWSSVLCGWCGAGTLEFLLPMPEPSLSFQFPHLTVITSLPNVRKPFWTAGEQRAQSDASHLPHALPQFPGPEGSVSAPTRTQPHLEPAAPQEARLVHRCVFARRAPPTAPPQSLVPASEHHWSCRSADARPAPPPGPNRGAERF